MPTATTDIHAPVLRRMGGVLERPLTLLRRGPGRSLRPVDLVATTAFVAGGALLLWSAYIHFHLWAATDDYRSIPTIGPLFLVQSIAGLVIGLGVIVLRRLWAALVGIGFAVLTVAGFLASVAHGLFGFEDSWQAPFAVEAFVVEVAAAGLLALAAILCLVPSAPHVRPGPTSNRPAT